MTTLEQIAERVRTAVCSRDFASAGTALDAYAEEIRRIAQLERDRSTLVQLKTDWKDLTGWARAMALAARELARDEWRRLPVACPYRTAADRPPSVISARG